MSLKFNLRHAENKHLRLEGQITATELDLTTVDDLIRIPFDLIRISLPISYEAEVQLQEKSLLVQGSWHLTLECECARCLKAFQRRLTLSHWTRFLALEGEEKVPIHNDVVDLTPFLREDILLELPQHPLCDVQCGGLPQAPQEDGMEIGGAGQHVESRSAWAALNRLKLRK